MNNGEIIDIIVGFIGFVGVGVTIWLTGPTAVRNREAIDVASAISWTARSFHDSSINAYLGSKENYLVNSAKIHAKYMIGLIADAQRLGIFNKLFAIEENPNSQIIVYNAYISILEMILNIKKNVDLNNLLTKQFFMLGNMIIISNCRDIGHEQDKFSCREFYYSNSGKNLEVLKMLKRDSKITNNN